jgi:Raf kinase inhibitor-like YbhB/YbcL family protein
MNRKFLTAAAAVVAIAVASFGAVAGCSAGNGSASSSGGRTATDVAATQSALRGPNPYEFLPKVPSFTLGSQTVRNGRPLPTPQLSGILGVPGGQDMSPQLSWSGFPAATKSFVVTMYDPQAPTGSGFWHWIVTDIPATTTSLPLNAGVPNSALLPAGAVQLNDDAGAARYIGGAPPKGSGVHDYYLTVTALDVAASGVGPSASGALLGFTIGSHTIARATIICPTWPAK